MGRAEDLFARLEGADGQQQLALLIEDQVHEEAFLEFKRSSDSGNGRFLSDSDLTNLSKGLSGFANSNGGVIVWGVGSGTGDNKHQATQILGLSDSALYAARVDDAISGRTVPLVQGVRSIRVGTCVATLIPESFSAPHQVVKTGEYFLRVGSSFRPAPHGVLAGLFGRSPRPAITVGFKIIQLGSIPSLNGPILRATVYLSIENVSSVIVREPYMTVRFSSLPNDEDEPEFTSLRNVFAASKHNKSSFSCMADAGMRLPPASITDVAVIQLNFRSHVRRNLEWTLTAGCADAAPIVSTYQVQADALDGYVARGRSLWISDPFSEGSEMRALPARIFGFNP